MSPGSIQSNSNLMVLSKHGRLCSATHSSADEGSAVQLSDRNLTRKTHNASVAEPNRSAKSWKESTGHETHWNSRFWFLAQTGPDISNVSEDKPSQSLTRTARQGCTTPVS